MIRIGITGGLGSGKSVVARILQAYGVPVYIADERSKQLTETSQDIREGLTQLFGERLYKEGQLDKKQLAAYIFNDQQALKAVNAIIHPVVNKDFHAWAEAQQTHLCAIESAILFESGFNKSVDLSLMVYAPLELRIQRGLVRDAVSREALLARIEKQMPDEEKKQLSDYTIYNDNQQALIPQVKQFLETISKRDRA